VPTTPRRSPDWLGTLTLGWLVVVLVATLWPFFWLDRPAPSLESGAARVVGRLPGLADIGRNVLLYAPLGLALAFRHWRLAAIVGLGAALASGVELAQIVVPGRDSSLADVVVDTLAVAAGALLARHVSVSSSQERGWNALVAGALGAVALLLPAVALRPVVSSGPYYPAWTPEPPPYVQLPGRVVAARIGEVPLPATGRVPEWGAPRAQLESGAPLAVRAVLDHMPAELAPIVRINGQGWFELILLAADGQDLVVRERGIGQLVGLEPPLFPAVGALRSVGAGAPFDLELRRDGLGWQVRVGGGASMALGPTPGSAWRLWVGSDPLSERTRRVLDALSLGLMFFAVGFWLRPTWPASAGLAVLGSALLAGPAVGGLLPTPTREWIAAGLGLALGASLGRLARRHAARVRQRAAMGPT